MSDDLKSKSCLVYDYGGFLPMAERLADFFGTVYYFMPWKSGLSRIDRLIIGWGLDNVHRVRNFWDAVKHGNIDLFVFPEVIDGDLQTHLVDLGKNVWGSRKAEELELYRTEFRQLQKKLGMKAPAYKVITGIAALREHLKEVKNRFVKLNLTRGDAETFHHENYALTRPRLDDIEHDVGAAGEVMDFLVEEPAGPDDCVEGGYDGWNIDGKWPDLAMIGYEIKNLGYLLSSVLRYDQLPKPMQECNSKLSPIFKDYGYRGFYSNELKIAPNGDWWMLEPTCRAGSPPSEIYQQIYSNFGEVLWRGAQGEVVQPKPIAKYGAQLILRSPWAAQNKWVSFQFPPELKKWIKLKDLCKINGTYWYVPVGESMVEIGSVIGLGNTLDEAIKKAEEVSKQIEGIELDVSHSAADDAMEAVKKGEKYGIKFITDED